MATTETSKDLILAIEAWWSSMGGNADPQGNGGHTSDILKMRDRYHINPSAVGDACVSLIHAATLHIGMNEYI